MGQRVPSYVRRICFGVLAKMMCISIEPPDYHWKISYDCESVSNHIIGFQQYSFRWHRNNYKIYSFISTKSSNLEIVLHKGVCVCVCVYLLCAPLLCAPNILRLHIMRFCILRSTFYTPILRFYTLRSHKCCTLYMAIVRKYSLSSRT